MAQKFISDVAMDAMQFSRMRQASASTGSSEAARKAASLKVNVVQALMLIVSHIFLFSKSKL